jgi:hypothetical protein
MSGFYKLEVRKTKVNDSTEDVLISYSVSGNSNGLMPALIKDYSFWNDKSGTTQQIIQFVGNDYVCIESSGSGKYRQGSGSWVVNELKTLPVDSLSNRKGIKISDLAGENGKIALESALADMPGMPDVGGRAAWVEDGLEESFSLYRKTGHWFFKGRMRIKESSTPAFLDYRINLIPPPEMVAYDVLQLPWTAIKDRVPEAVDAFTSPNRDIAVIVTKSSLLIYGINGMAMSEKPLAKIALKEGDSVIMAEWALGRYVEKWEAAFVKYNEERAAAVSR